jgi:signal transduction histidine kinase
MESTTGTGSIVVIDDDQTMRRACAAALSRVGYEVETYADGESGLKRVEELSPGVVVTDLKMPGIGGIEVIDRVRQIDPDIVVVVITGFATIDSAVEAMKCGAYDFIPKPFRADELRAIIGRASERWRLSREARRLRAEKEAQAHRFVTFVSHQLQSPLGTVQQYLDVLVHQAGESLAGRAREWIDRSRAKIVEMRQIITDWLAFAKIESGQLAAQWRPLGLAPLVAAVCEDFAGDAAQRPVMLRHELPSDLPMVLADETALRMLLSNLVSNAIKYGRPRGQVTVSAAAEPDRVLLSVADDGIGIAADQLPHIFEEFYRVRNGSTAGVGGTGMGLAICQRIAEELGGSIDVTSTPGVGTTFTVALASAPRPTAANGAAGA